MNEVTKPTLTLMIAQFKDRNTIFEWVNDPQVRRASFQSGEIQEQEHTKWFSAILNDPDSRIWILNKNDVPCGMVRVERVDGIATLSYSVAASHRGKGLSVPMLKLALREIAKIWPKERVVAWTRSDNVASIRVLEKARFHRDNTEKKRVRFMIALNG